MKLAITQNKESGLYEIRKVGGIYDGYVHNSYQRKANAEKWVAQRLQREADAAGTRYCPSCLVEDLFSTDCRRHC